MKRRRIAIVLILSLPFVGCGAIAAYGHLWSAGAEAAIRRTVLATAEGSEPARVIAHIDTLLDPSSKNARVDSLDLRADFRLSYVIEGADNELGGTGWLDLLSPGVYVAYLRFTNGHLYWVEARHRHWRQWEVWIGPSAAAD